MRGQGSPPPGEVVALNILVCDAASGEAYFKANCSSCHSAAADLRGIASATPDPTQLQNLWVAGGRGGRGGVVPSRRQVIATVTLANGQKVDGQVDRIDDFLVVLTTADGAQRSFSRTTPGTTVDVRDPLEQHRRLLGVYTDRDIHNVTAYLVTLE
jgi:cytochrome c oxidase cbb3-type subunit 3